jgi:hypothetical protein
VRCRSSYGTLYGAERAHLKESQRGMVAARIAKMAAHRPSGTVSIETLTMPSAAKMMNVAQKQTVGLNKGRAGMGRPGLGGTAKEPPKDPRPTLAEAGIGKKLSARAFSSPSSRVRRVLHEG